MTVKLCCCMHVTAQTLYYRTAAARIHYTFLAFACVTVWRACFRRAYAVACFALRVRRRDTLHWFILPAARCARALLRTPRAACTQYIFCWTGILSDNTSRRSRRQQRPRAYAASAPWRNARQPTPYSSIHRHCALAAAHTTVAFNGRLRA